MEKAKALAAEAKIIISGFYLHYILQLLLNCPEPQWLSLTQQERCNELLIADSVLLWHPQNTHLLNSALRVYQRLSDHKIMVDSTELEMTSNLLNKKRTSIEANELPPREQCPACKDHILFVVSHTFASS